MVVGAQERMVRIACNSCGFSNLVQKRERHSPLTEPGSYSFVPKASPTCARCMKVMPNA